MHQDDPIKEPAYKRAGVDIEAGNRAVEMMRASIEKTRRPEVIGSIGGFAGMFALDCGYKEPVLVSGTDGVGTKLKIAKMMGAHDTVGIDLVAMCVNDIIVTGAEPLFFLDYLAVGMLEPKQVAEIVSGIASGCVEAGCALVGGETAEMPGFYGKGEYDIAGFAVGVVEKDDIIDGRDIRAGDAIIGLVSSGIHSNGFSLARKIIFEDSGLRHDQILPRYAHTIGEELLKPTSIYAKAARGVLEEVSVKGMAHITGGGLTENVPRVLPKGISAELDTNMWEVPEIFATIQDLGNVDEAEMFKTFNMGIGMVMIVDDYAARNVVEILEGSGVEAVVIGKAVLGEEGTIYV